MYTPHWMKHFVRSFNNQQRVSAIICFSRSFN